MKYKLINKTTQKEFICDKITFEGFDYYSHNPSSINISNMSVMDYAMATNNPNIDLPKVIDENSINIFTEQDMIEFSIWANLNAFVLNNEIDWYYAGKTYTSKELLEIWKEQQVKTIYYE